MIKTQTVFVASIALFNMACTPAPELPTGGLDTSHPQGDGLCDAAAVQTYLGQLAKDDLGSAILRESGSRTLRWGGPDTAFTMDYREDRINVIYDASGIIERITCG